MNVLSLQVTKKTGEIVQEDETSKARYGYRTVLFRATTNIL